jgi:GNAT superfamily N-acetyltransferase
MSLGATLGYGRSTGLRHKSGPADSHSGRGRDRRYDDSIRFRRAIAADSPALARAVFEALGDYAAFAPPGWTAPSLEEIDEEGFESLANEDVYCVLAESKDEVVGQITVLPATQTLHPNDDPALGHIRNFFVTRDFWATGLAGDLHRAALDAARERRFTELRLFVPAGQARARRFYERAGWLPIANQFDDPISGFAMLEYRYRL